MGARVGSRHLTKRLNVEFVINRFDFSEGSLSTVLTDMQGLGMEGNLLYNFVSQTRIKLFIGAGLQTSRLVYKHTTGPNATATFSSRRSETPLLQLDKNDSGSYTMIRPGLTLLAGMKIQLVKNYFFTLEPVLLPPPGPVLNTVRMGLEFRF